MVPDKYKSEDGYPFGQWVGGQRQRRKRKRMPDEEIQKLNNIDFIWDAKSKN